MIDIQTKFITLIGTPLGQSYAARMQNSAYRAMGENLQYFYTETGSEEIGTILAGIRAMPSFAGCAVTKPNKIEAMRYLDEYDPFCEQIGSVNTVVKTPEGKLRGYNTDGMGFYRSLLEHYSGPVENLHAYCLGAGGAGRAICSVLAYHGCGNILISDKNETAAAELVEDINRNFIGKAVFVPFGDYSALAGCEVVMNATGIGMGKTVGMNPIPADRLNPEQLCFDACYNPPKTRFLLDAEARGCRIFNGLDMSLYQGAAQIELWTGRPAPVEVMRNELITILKEH